MKYTFYQPQAIHEIGKRKNQEDSIFPAVGVASTDSRLFIVCDGMGGHEKGEVASATVVNAISQYINNRQDLSEPLTEKQFGKALDAAYDALDQIGEEGAKKMGTTLTLLCFHRGGCLAAHIGDSRIYHLRPSTGETLYRSRDHSLVQQLYEMGELSYHEMKTAPNKNIVLKAMQPHQDMRVKADVVHITDIKPGDYFYLCTDGMLEQMEDYEIMGLLCEKNMTDEQRCQRLIDLTEDNADNHSAYLIHIKGVENEESDSEQPNTEAQARKANKVLSDPDRNTQPAVVEYSEPEVTIIREAPHPKPAPAPRPAATKPQEAAPVKKKSPIATILIAIVLILVAILTGFTVYNYLSQQQQQEMPKKKPFPVEDPNKIKYAIDDEDADNAVGGYERMPQKKKALPKDTTDRTVNEIFQTLEEREGKDAMDKLQNLPEKPEKRVGR